MVEDIICVGGRVADFESLELKFGEAVNYCLHALTLYGRVVSGKGVYAVRAYSSSEWIDIWKVQMTSPGNCWKAR